MNVEVTFSQCSGIIKEIEHVIKNKLGMKEYTICWNDDGDLDLIRCSRPINMKDPCDVVNIQSVVCKFFDDMEKRKVYIGANVSLVMPDGSKQYLVD
jgi:hypothetical protein